MVTILILGLMAAIAVALFALVNNTPVMVNLLFWKSQETSLALVILYSALVGALVVWLIGLPEKIRLKLAVRRLEGLKNSTNIGKESRSQ